MSAKTVISGILLLDKSQGISSHSALAKAKFLFKSDSQDSKKAGHTGTLDPMATGLLPLVFGEATKFAQYGLDADKGYTATIRLGVATDSGDADGQVIDTAFVPNFSQAELDQIAAAMTGAQSQIPPMYSALKKDGKKLYEYARDGIEIERAPRAITIHHLSLTKLDDEHIRLSVICSKGTYVRVLGEDIAKRLGTLGHLTSLRRTLTGGFGIDDAISMDAFEALPMAERLGRLLPIDAMLMHLPILAVNDDEAARLKLGQRLNVKDRVNTLPSFTETCLVRLYADGEFLGLGEVANTGRLQPKKLVA
ncbi:tRNA pseudouridine(55) synthase TruB [Moraxella sp. FZFQ2102]|uniref:tRNA pseudouridine(55) synthase TruB n=1 Tax=Moraxella sp. FZFQ2102 TaxID=2953752 RepID=UPI00209C5630|nr:tRNA pseudouridine(55) synthase TruB [Moraxella sp. FZFQ2102]USZ15656.1 tRNA pseudouridine(55) synthase TruB [Moraxella sp. FZFQ2102]